eukprot:3791344-Amphidinium_carterae.1
MVVIPDLKLGKHPINVDSSEVLGKPWAAKRILAYRPGQNEYNSNSKSSRPTEVITKSFQNHFMLQRCCNVISLLMSEQML